MPNLIEVKITDHGVLKKLQSLENWRKLAGPPIGMALVRGTQQRFRQGVDPDGKRWTPLNPAYASIKRGAGILRASNQLMNSITYQATPNIIHVGTNKIYAPVHQFGATITPKKPGGRLVFNLSSGLVFAKSVTIPARPFLGVSKQDKQAILDVLRALIESSH